MLRHPYTGMKAWTHERLFRLVAFYAIIGIAAGAGAMFHHPENGKRVDVHVNETLEATNNHTGVFSRGRNNLDDDQNA